MLNANGPPTQHGPPNKRQSVADTSPAFAPGAFFICVEAYGVLVWRQASQLALLLVLNVLFALSRRLPRATVLGGTGGKCPGPCVSAHVTALRQRLRGSGLRAAERAEAINDLLWQ